VSDNPVNVQKVNNFLTDQEGYFTFNRQDRHIVLLRLTDFNCPPCFEDFVGYSHQAQQFYDSSQDMYRIVGLVEQSGPIINSTSLHAWSAANEIQFPLFLVPDSVFAQFNFTKSCVVLQRPLGTLRFVYKFPGNESGRMKLISAFMK
jgi:hypothetical protein